MTLSTPGKIFFLKEYEQKIFKFIWNNKKDNIKVYIYIIIITLGALSYRI